MLTWHLAELMAAKRVKGKDLAVSCGMSPQYISKLRQRRTKPNMSALIEDSLCRGLGCQPGDLSKYVVDEIEEQ